jgi:hypothetical protein
MWPVDFFLFHEILYIFNWSAYHFEKTNSIYDRLGVSETNTQTDSQNDFNSKLGVG